MERGSGQWVSLENLKLIWLQTKLVVCHVTQGETALLSVARHGHATVLLHLLSNAQQKVIHNKNKQTPLDVAVKQDNDEIAMVIAGHPRWVYWIVTKQQLQQIYFALKCKYEQKMSMNSSREVNGILQDRTFHDTRQHNTTRQNKIY